MDEFEADGAFDAIVEAIRALIEGLPPDARKAFEARYRSAIGLRRDLGMNQSLQESYFEKLDATVDLVAPLREAR